MLLAGAGSARCVFAEDDPAAPAGGAGQEEAPAPGVELSSATLRYDEEYLFDEQLAAGKADPRQQVQEAETVYRQAVRSYTEGNLVRARELYARALALLSSVDISPGMHFELCGDFSDLFARIKELLCREPVQEQEGKYSIPLNTDDPGVQRYLRYYGSGEGRRAFLQALARSARYRPLVEKILREYGLPEELVYVPFVESQYNNNNVSSAGAVGLWQLMPERARALGLRVNRWIDERKDPEKATRAACRYLKELYLMFDDWPLALAAYNRGEYGLERDLRTAGATTIAQAVERKALPRETRCFVPRFIACALIAESAAGYEMTVAPEDAVEYDTVRIDRAIDLRVVARCVRASVGEIRRLNPSLIGWCTPRNYPDFELHLPAGSLSLFVRNISREPNLTPGE
jgi:membrane-bound lytic murein transglycosylase D